MYNLCCIIIKLMKKFFIYLLFFISYCHVQAAGEFTMTVDTTITNLGSSLSDQMQIPTFAGRVYNYTVDWGDGNITSNIVGTVTHTYAVSGVYQLKISGTFPHIYFNNTGDAIKVISIDQWGTNIWASMERAFAGTSNMTAVVAVDAPNLSVATSTAYMFANSAMNSDISTWNMSHIVDMEGMFTNNTQFNQNLSAWNVSQVTNMNSLFYNAQAFNGNVSTWNTGNVVDMATLFSSTPFNSDISAWNTASVTSMAGMFEGDANFNQDISNWNTSSVTNMTSMFNNATSFNQNINSWNVSQVSNMSSMFLGATSFNQPLNNWNTASVTNMASMFSGASVFNQNLGSWNVESVTDLTDFLLGANLSAVNYDGLLEGWAVQNVQSGLAITVDTGIWCNASASRLDLATNHSWSFIDTGVTIGCPAPTVTSVTSSDANGDYRTGQTVHIQVVFSEAVAVTGTPELVLETGTTDTVATYTSGSGSNTLVFTYVVQSSDTSTDLQYISTSALTGSIADNVNAGLPARLTLPALVSVNSIGGSKAITINTVVSNSSQVSTGGWSSPSSVTYSGTVQSGGGSTCILFTTHLRSSQKHDEVPYIKSFLNMNLNTRLNTSSDVFDLATKKAVIRFQEKYKKDILYPSRLKKGTGLWYTQTMRKANDLMACKK